MVFWCVLACVSTIYVEQHGGVWQIEIPKADNLRLTGEISNPRCPGHSHPKHIDFEVKPGIDVACQVSDACFLYLSVTKEPDGKRMLTVKHEHGSYSTVGLLGKLKLSWDGGSETWVLDRDDPPEFRFEPQSRQSDKGFFFSAPDSTVLFAVDCNRMHGDASYEAKVRPHSKVLVRFRYYVAKGSEGEFRLHVRKSRTTIDGFSHQGYEKFTLTKTKGWSMMEKVIETGDSNEITVQFSIDSPLNQYTAWVDDLEIKHVGFRERKP